jgi:hypothetical protein
MIPNEFTSDPFLSRYTVNGKQFYKTAVMAMKELDSQQMIVRFAHVLSSNGPLATLLCNCFDRYFSVFHSQV